MKQSHFLLDPQSEGQCEIHLVSLSIFLFVGLYGTFLLNHSSNFYGFFMELGFHLTYKVA